MISLFPQFILTFINTAHLEQIIALYTFGQFQYCYGSYTGATNYLCHFHPDNDLNNFAHLSKLASDILTGRWPMGGGLRRAQHPHWSH